MQRNGRSLALPDNGEGLTKRASRFRIIFPAEVRGNVSRVGGPPPLISLAWKILK
jgi:hypothetical protein